MANDCIKDHFFRNVPKGGDVIVEAIEQLQRDIVRIDGSIEDINGSIEDINGQISDLGGDLSDLREELKADIENLESAVNILASGDYTFVKWHGAVGDGVADDTAAIQEALDSGKTYVFFDKGAYFVSSTGYGVPCLTVPSNTHLIGLGATIINQTASSIALVNKSPALINPTVGGGYDANENIIIEELNFVGDNNASLGFIGLMHCKNCKIINCNFTDLGGWHFIELNATRDTVISGCTFKNYEGANITEMVQLDIATHQDVFPFFGPYDRTPACNITIENCFFSGNSAYYHNSENYFKIAPAAIGNHNSSATRGENVHHITVKGCYFNTLQTCLKFSSLRNSIIESNQAEEVRHFFNATDMTSENTTYFGGLKICNNRAVTALLPAEVITFGQSTTTRCIGFYGVNCEVSGNDIYGWSGYAINIGGSGHLIEDNAITACGRIGIYIFGNQDCIISGNKVIGNCAYSMAGDYDIKIIPDGSSNPSSGCIISCNLLDTARLENPGATSSAFINNVVKSAVSKAAGDDTIYHANTVNGSWIA